MCAGGKALVEVFSTELLRDSLRFRGGTALNKLHLPAPVGYSGDIESVRSWIGCGPCGSRGFGGPCGSISESFFVIGRLTDQSGSQAR